MGPPLDGSASNGAFGHADIEVARRPAPRHAMIFEPTALPDAYIIRPEQRIDPRGSFARTMCVDEFHAHGINETFVQQNVSVTKRQGTVRGMHFQCAPHREGKLVRCVRGAICDVIVDLRLESPTYLTHTTIWLDDSTMDQVYVPPGFAHGFQTLTDDVEMSYLLSHRYVPSAQGGLFYRDPILDIAWPLSVASLSDRDAAWPLIDAMKPPAL